MKKVEDDDVIVTKFKELKESGLEAKNPDQSCSMERSFSELVKVCRWKGFSESDIDILFKTAKESSKIVRPKA